jgi:hypothetical protein
MTDSENIATQNSRTVPLRTRKLLPKRVFRILVESPNYGKGLRRFLKRLGDDSHFERDFSRRDGTPYNLLNIVHVEIVLLSISVPCSEEKPVLDFLAWGV